MNLEKLFNPKSIAVVGASEENGKVGNVVAKNLLKRPSGASLQGYQGEVYFVNPKHEKLFEKKCYKNLGDIKGEVDLAVIAIPAKFVSGVIKEAADKVKNYVVISAGFAEIEDGKKREAELKNIAAENNLNILGPNCLGFIIPSLKLNASFAGSLPEAGNIALISQSGALAVAMMDAAENSSLSFSAVISVGNKMQISETELLEYFEKDEKTKVIGMYLEGIKDGRKFMEAAQKTSKPVIVLKTGRTEKSQKTISSHTGALAGDDEIVSEVMKELGIVRSENAGDFLSQLNLVSKLEKLENEEVIILTNAGGLGVLAADSFKNKKIKLAEISAEIKKELRTFLPEESSVENPIDLLGDADEKRYEKTLQAVEKEKADSIICILTPQDQTPVKKIAEEIAAFKKKTSKKILSVFMGGKRIEEAKNILEENGVPVFFLVEQAINSLDGYHKSLGHRMSKYASVLKDRDIFEKVSMENRKILNYEEVDELLKEYEIKIPKIFNVGDSDIKYPVAIKIDSDKFLHKTDQGALKLNIQNKDELEKSLSEMEKKFPGEKKIIQSMVPVGTELILGIKRDPDFGPVIIFGLGGIYAEIFKMTDLMLPGNNVEEVKAKILESKIKFLFSEVRGQAPYNLDELAKILASLSQLAMENKEIKELDINPLIIYNNGEKAVAVDVKIIV